MADSRAENIITAIVTAVTSLDTTSANVFRGRVYELPETSLPCLCVYLGFDNPRSDGGSSSWVYIDSDLTINIEAVVKDSSAQVDTTLNQIRYEIGQALQADITQGLAYVMNTTEGPAGVTLDGVGDETVGRMRMEWTVLYRRLRHVTPILPTTYPLDAGSAEVISLGFLPMTLSGGDQTAKLALAGGGSNRQANAFAAGAATGTSDTIAFNAGAKAIEWAPIMPASVGGGAFTAAWQLELTIMTQAFATICQVKLQQNADGTKQTSVNLLSGSVYSDTSAFPTRIGVALDSSTSTVRVYFDDAILTLSSSAYTPAVAIAAITVYEKTACPAGDAAKLVGATLYTLNTDMTGTTYETGTTDIGGNVI